MEEKQTKKKHSGMNSCKSNAKNIKNNASNDILTFEYFCTVNELAATKVFRPMPDLKNVITIYDRCTFLYMNT